MGPLPLTRCKLPRQLETTLCFYFISIYQLSQIVSLKNPWSGLPFHFPNKCILKLPFAAFAGSILVVVILQNTVPKPEPRGKAPQFSAFLYFSRKNFKLPKQFFALCIWSYKNASPKRNEMNQHIKYEAILCCLLHNAENTVPSSRINR